MGGSTKRTQSKASRPQEADGAHVMKSSVFAHWKIAATHSTKKARVTLDLSTRDLIKDNI